jgi:arylsulfatase A-like enzyme
VKKFTRRRVVQGLGAGATVGCIPDETPRVTPEQALPSEGPTRRPRGIVLLFPDQFRSPSLESSPFWTPNLDRFFADSARFSRAVTPDPVCAPARASLLTGLYPKHHGVIANRVDWLEPNTDSLGMRFAAAGWRTAWIGKWHLSPEEEDFGGFVAPEYRQGFEFFASNRYAHNYQNPLYYRDSTEGIRPHEFEPTHQTWLLDEFLSTVGDDESFLAVVSYGPPHPKGIMPDEWGNTLPHEFIERIHRDDLTLRGNVADYLLGDGIYDALRQAHGYYAAQVAIDDEVATVLDILQVRGLTNDTLVVFTSDHGEQLASQGLWGKETSYEESIRIPLAFRWPSQLEPSVSDAPVTLADLGPTLHHLAGLGDWETDGMDVGHWLWNPDASPPRSVVPIVGRHRSPLAFQAVLDGAHKYTKLERVGTELLFNLVDDPLEQVNLAGDPAVANEMERLREVLATAMLSIGES